MKGNITVGLIIGLLIGGLVSWSVLSSKDLQSKVGVFSVSMTQKEATLNKGMRVLWLDHIWWTREYLKSFFYAEKDVNVVANRLLKNQEDIGNAIKPYYGVAAGDKLISLLKTHILGAVDLVTAAKSGNKANFDKANKAWYDNAQEIASFLAGANPNWKLADVSKMMRDHLDLTKQEAVDIMGNNYSASVADFEKVQAEILMMADALSAGIVMQFPKMF